MSGSENEFELIAKLRKLAMPHDRVPLGIGDDCAIVGGDANGRWLVAADMLLEGRHFDPSTATPRLIGRKSLAVNLSDVAAMAGRPLAAFVTVAHHRPYGIAFAEEVHRGIAELAEEFSVAVAGGDTNVWDGPIVVSVTLLGDIVGGRAVTRSGAKPGDVIFVTGPLGGSLASGRHLTFKPRVCEAALLHEFVNLHAMIDISDGLLADLGHICDESGVAAHLHAERIPVHPTVEQRTERSRLEQALTDGEDFELAFCVAPDDAERLRTNPPTELAVFEIGSIHEGRGVTVLDQGRQPLSFPFQGWQHRW